MSITDLERQQVAHDLLRRFPQPLLALASAHQRLSVLLNTSDPADEPIAATISVLIFEGLYARNFTTRDLADALTAMRQAVETMRTLSMIPDEIPLSVLPDMAEYRVEPRT